MKGPRIYYAILSLFMFLSLSVFSQKLTKQQREIIKKDLKYYIFSDTTGYCYDMGEQNFVVLGMDTFYNPDGFHLLYKLKNGNATRLDKSRFHGHNFGRILYSYNNKIYLIGGYGLFTTNNIIESFDPVTHEWNFVSSKGERPEYIRGVLFKRDSIIYLFNSFKSGNNTEPDILEKNYYEYNIKSNNWKKFENKNDLFAKTLFINTYYLKDYIVSFSMENTLIIKKSNLKYLLLPNGELPFHIHSTVINNIDNNIISYVFSGSTTANTTNVKIDVDSLFKNRDAGLKLLILGSQPLSDNTNTILYSFVTIIFLVISLLFYKRSKRNDLKLIDIYGEMPKNRLVQNLIHFNNNIIGVDDLDVIFEINHMEAESKKSKRHRIITNLEQEYPGLITRVKDETDKRKFVYHIDKELVK